MSPKKIRMVPEKYCQNDCGISIKYVEAFRRSVKTTTDTARDAVMTYGFHLERASAREPPTITGKSGSTHGASTVRIPATNEIKRNVIPSLYTIDNQLFGYTFRYMKRVVKGPKQRKKVVYATGCFDLLHYGHIRYLEKVKRYGDILIVAIASDALTRRKKGHGRPIIPELHRAYLLKSLRIVDKVFICRSKHEFLKVAIKNNVNVMAVNGRDSSRIKEMLERKKLFQKNISGIKIIDTSYKKGKLSTTKIVRKILKEHGKGL